MSGEGRVRYQPRGLGVVADEVDVLHAVLIPLDATLHQHAMLDSVHVRIGYDLSQ